MQETKSRLTKVKILTDFKDVFEGFRHLGKANFTVDLKVMSVHHALTCIAVTLHIKS